MKSFTYNLVKSLLLVGALLGLVVAFSPAHAAYLHMPSAGKTVEQGDVFSVDFFITSPEQAMNALSAVATFPVDTVQFDSFEKDGSLIDLWTTGPRADTRSGTIVFEGVILNPGFTGSGGRVFTVNFRALKTGVASFELTTQTVLANDGRGTEITSRPTQTRVDYTIVKKESTDTSESESGSDEAPVAPGPVIIPMDEAPGALPELPQKERSDERRRSGLPEDVVIDAAVSVEVGGPEVISFETFAEVEKRSAKSKRSINILWIIIIILSILLVRKYYHYHELRRGKHVHHSKYE